MPHAKCQLNYKMVLILDIGLFLSHILSLAERLIHSCKPLWIPSPSGISEWMIPLPAVIHCIRMEEQEHHKGHKTSEKYYYHWNTIFCDWFSNFNGVFCIFKTKTCKSPVLIVPVCPAKSWWVKAPSSIYVTVSKPETKSQNERRILRHWRKSKKTNRVLEKEWYEMGICQPLCGWSGNPAGAETAKKFIKSNVNKNLFLFLHQTWNRLKLMSHTK